ncbi:MAG: hypothetical protein WCL07_04720 [bacterium]
MKKLLLAIIVCSAMISAVTTKAQAFEGQIDISGSGVSCKATSVWHESRYRVIGRCDGLVYPYQTQYEYYTIWAHDSSRNTYVRIDDIDRGYFEGDVTSTFDKVLISAEQDSGPRRPSSYTIATGTVAKFAFDKSEVSIPKETSPVVSNTSKTTAVQSTSSTSTSGSVVGRIITSLLIILLVVVGIVIAGSLIFRSRGSVSA